MHLQCTIMEVGCPLLFLTFARSQVISADMFATRFEGNCMSVEVGMAYREEVLAPGGTGKIMDHLKVFLGGRAPQQEPFLRSRGIIKQ